MYGPAGVVEAPFASPEIIASARSSMVDVGAQIPSGAAHEKLPLTLPPKLAHPPRATSRVRLANAGSRRETPRRAGALTTSLL
ncbi:MAG: hypothetical protein WA085_15100 [Sphingobium sp.]|uniref:hypothetical protein n=1 Tax=Sphingobium sp. CECT 9361 TaxID=2845384 RepID=UPI001E3AD277|nr:hypothetical protein [Sphingobium sp. CECT 9361]